MCTALPWSFTFSPDNALMEITAMVTVISCQLITTELFSTIFTVSSPQVPIATIQKRHFIMNYLVFIQYKSLPRSETTELLALRPCWKAVAGYHKLAKSQCSNCSLRRGPSTAAVQEVQPCWVCVLSTSHLLCAYFTQLLMLVFSLF